MEIFIKTEFDSEKVSTPNVCDPASLPPMIKTELDFETECTLSNPPVLSSMVTSAHSSENADGSNACDPPVISSPIDVKESIDEKGNFPLFCDPDKSYFNVAEKDESPKAIVISENPVPKLEISDDEEMIRKMELKGNEANREFFNENLKSNEADENIISSKCDNSNSFELKCNTEATALEICEEVSLGGLISTSNQTDEKPTIGSDVEEKLKMNTASNGNEITLKRCPYTNYGDPCDIVVPLIGKPNKMTPENMSKKITFDLLRTRAAAREEDKEMAKNYPTYEELRRQRLSRTPEEIEQEANERRSRDMNTAALLIRLNIKILKEMGKEEPDQEKMEKLFLSFFDIRTTPMSLVYASQFVHTMMYVRGSEEFSRNVRRMANECYFYVHSMFPIPEGYNFETVYSSEVKKYSPAEFDSMDGYPLDYGDFDESDSD